MALLKILEYPDRRLRLRAKPVAQVDDAIRRLVGDLLETMYAAPGIGLAATQVDVQKRVLVLDISEEKNEPFALINPEVMEREAPEIGDEGCLSVPGYIDAVERPRRVRVKALGLDGRPIDMVAEGLLAVCIQHEIDHLDGKLFVDYLSELKRERLKKKLAKTTRHEPQAQGSRDPAPVI